MYDVLVVGGGPVGSYLAGRLAQAGHYVVVVEQKQMLGEPVCCTGIVSQECMDSFAIDDNVILRRANSAKFFSPSGNLVHLQHPQLQACILDRAAFDLAIAQRVQARGAKYVLNCLVNRIEVGDDKVRVEATRQGKQLSYEARAVVMATGFGSGLVEDLGLGKISYFATGVQAEVETTGVDEVEVYFGQEIAPGFFAWLVPTLTGKARVGLLAKRNPSFYLKKLLSSLKSQGKIASGDVEFTYGVVPLKPLARTYGDRLMVVGEAAGQVKPTTAGGIYYGLVCADLAIEILHAALEKDDLSAKSLASYERAWRKKLGRELKIGYYARKLYERLSDGQIDRIFDIIKSNKIDEMLLQADDLSFDWHSNIVLRLIKHLVVHKAIKPMKSLLRFVE